MLIVLRILRRLNESEGSEGSGGVLRVLRVLKVLTCCGSNQFLDLLEKEISRNLSKMRVHRREM